MEWLNIHASTIDSEVLQDAEPRQVAAWLFLQRYCIGQENGGRIRDCREWPELKWLKAVSVQRSDVLAPSGLWHWEANDLLVSFYPHEQEALLQSRRLGGRLGGKTRGKQLKAAARSRHAGQSQAESQTEPERKGREGQGTEGNSKGSESAPRSDCAIPSLEEVRTWAAGPAGVDPEYAQRQWHTHTERNAWVANGQLIDWRHRFKRFWEEDREQWFSRKKTAPAANGAREATDDPLWWELPLDSLNGLAHGLALGNEQNQARRVLDIYRARGGKG